MPTIKPEIRAKLTGSGLAKNTFWNFLGQIIPLLLAFFCIPVLLRSLGIERFGVLTLAWMITGYFSVFDLGLGRALTKLVAERLDPEHRSELHNLIWTAMLLMSGLGILGGGIFALLSPWLIQSCLKIPGHLQRESLTSFYLLAISIPIVVSTTGLRGILEAQHKFGVANLARIPTAIFTFLAPVIVIHYRNTLPPVIGIIVVGRVLGCLLHLSFSIQGLAWYHGVTESSAHFVRLLLGFGGWMTVSNLVSPLMVYADRFMIGSFISVAAVAYYATPFEMATKLWIIPSAITGVLFPAFATTAKLTSQRTAYLFERGNMYIMVLLFPAILATVTFAKVGLSLWLNPLFASHATFVLQLLALGIFMNCIGHLPFCLIQALGRPDLTAKVHAIELPAYLALVWLLITHLGVVGAAIAWSLRVGIETTALMILSTRLLPQARGASHNIAIKSGVSLTLFAGGGLIEGLPYKLLYFIVVTLIFALYTWRKVFTEQERLIVFRGVGLRMEPAQIAVK